MTCSKLNALDEFLTVLRKPLFISVNSGVIHEALQ